MKKCVYCGAELEEDSVVDVCERCGVGGWGRKMFESIKENMKTARKKDAKLDLTTIRYTI